MFEVNSWTGRADGILLAASFRNSLVCLLGVWLLTGSCVCPIRGNTSVDESYEWDSSDARVDLDVLGAPRFDQFHRGGGRDQAAGLQDQQQTGERCDGVCWTLHVSSWVRWFITACVCPVHAFPFPAALPRPVSLAHPASFHPAGFHHASLPVQQS